MDAHDRLWIPQNGSTPLLSPPSKFIFEGSCSSSFPALSSSLDFDRDHPLDPSPGHVHSSRSNRFKGVIRKWKDHIKRLTLSSSSPDGPYLDDSSKKANKKTKTKEKAEKKKSGGIWKMRKSHVANDDLHDLGVGVDDQYGDYSDDDSDDDDSDDEEYEHDDDEYPVHRHRHPQGQLQHRPRSSPPSQPQLQQQQQQQRPRSSSFQPRLQQRQRTSSRLNKADSVDTSNSGSHHSGSDFFDGDGHHRRRGRISYSFFWR